MNKTSEWTISTMLERMRASIIKAAKRINRLPTAHASHDLGHSLARIQHDFPDWGNVGFRVLVSGEPQPLRTAVTQQVYWIGREAITKAFQHAGATDVEVETDYSTHRLRIIIRDNGLGIDPQLVHSGHEARGLTKLRERAEDIGARLRVWSGSASGTEMELTVPGSVAFEDRFAVSMATATLRN